MGSRETSHAARRRTTARKTRFCKTTPCIKNSSLSFKDIACVTSCTSATPESRSGARIRSSTRAQWRDANPRSCRWPYACTSLSRTRRREERLRARYRRCRPGRRGRRPTRWGLRAADDIHRRIHLAVGGGGIDGAHEDQDLEHGNDSVFQIHGASHLRNRKFRAMFCFLNNSAQYADFYHMPAKGIVVVEPFPRATLRRYCAVQRRRGWEAGRQNRSQP